MYDGELSGQARPTTLARLSAEIRHCERQSLHMLERVRLTAEPPMRYARIHLAADTSGGTGGIVSAESLRQMQEPVKPVPGVEPEHGAKLVCAGCRGGSRFHA